jgi:predicted RNA-binding protein with PUA-like domain
MNYWLLKTEPEEWSWQHQSKNKKLPVAWDGVRNFQARNFLQKMNVGDLCFFYHTGSEKQIVGVVRVTKRAFPDKTDKTKKFVSIMVQFHSDLDHPVTLESIKKNKQLKGLLLLKQSRLSVMPIGLKCWKIINNMGKINA